MGVVDIPYKYLGLTPKSKKDIKKVNRVIFFFDLTVELSLGYNIMTSEQVLGRTQQENVKKKCEKRPKSRFFGPFLGGYWSSSIVARCRRQK